VRSFVSNDLGGSTGKSWHYIGAAVGKRTLRKPKAGPIQELGLSLFGTDYAPDSDLPAASLCRRQDDVGTVEPAQFLKRGPRGVAETSLFLPLLERFPEHMGEEADENVRLNALGFLVPMGRIASSLS
jgi:hypothetical protein